MFFCKYNDPIYVKMEKLETIIRLVNDRNIDQVGAAACRMKLDIIWIHERAAEGTGWRMPEWWCRAPYKRKINGWG